jgi:hypothetical protein
MPRKEIPKATGVFEKVPGSGVWWIRYRDQGKLHREKVGRRQDAIDLYKLRKANFSGAASFLRTCAGPR